MANAPEKIKCPHCGQDVIKGAYKCRKCGKPLAQIKPPAVDAKAELITCPNCGAQVRKGVYKCPSCNNVLHSTASAVADAAKPKSICPHCGKEIVKGSSKCRSCGKTISAAHHPVPESAEPKTEASAGQAAAPTPVDDKHCPKCGKEAPAGKTFCPFCGTRLARPTQITAATEPDLDLPAPIPPMVIYLALGSVAAALLAGFINMLPHSVWIAAIPAAISIGLGAYALIKNQMHGPALVKILSGVGILTAIFGLVSPRITLPCAILAAAGIAFYWLRRFLNSKFTKRMAASIMTVCGFAFLTVFGYFVEGLVGIFLKKPSSDVGPVEPGRIQPRRDDLLFAQPRVRDQF